MDEIKGRSCKVKSLCRILRMVVRAVKLIALRVARAARRAWSWLLLCPPVFHCVARFEISDLIEFSSPYRKWPVHNRNCIPDSPSFA